MLGWCIKGRIKAGGVADPYIFRVTSRLSRSRPKLGLTHGAGRELLHRHLHEDVVVLEEVEVRALGALLQGRHHRTHRPRVIPVVEGIVRHCQAHLFNRHHCSQSRALSSPFLSLARAPEAKPELAASQLSNFTTLTLGFSYPPLTRPFSAFNFSPSISSAPPFYPLATVRDLHRVAPFHP
jgi:hypothetical protein